MFLGRPNTLKDLRVLISKDVEEMAASLEYAGKGIILESIAGKAAGLLIFD